MKMLPFKTSSVGSIGVELEYQIVNPHSFALVSRAKDLMRIIQSSPFEKWIKPEITQSMIELNSSIHLDAKDLLAEFFKVQEFLITQADSLQVLISGGGTHPFQRWSMQKIFPTVRYKKLSRKFRYLSKRSTVFGQHVHVGCANGNDALYLTHAMIRYVPHFIALCASSPFYQGVDTGFCSSRSTVFNAFPLSGVIPYLLTWEEFSNYYYRMRSLGIISSMKDFYWDIRPKPEFGTVEIRVCDTPLTIEKAVQVAAYIQAVALYLLEEKPVSISNELYYIYTTNRFQASRYGFDGEIIEANSCTYKTISADILETIKKIERYANRMNSMPLISQLYQDVINQKNDASLIRQIVKQTGSLPKLVEEQCQIWAHDKRDEI